MTDQKTLRDRVLKEVKGCLSSSSEDDEWLWQGIIELIEPHASARGTGIPADAVASAGRVKVLADRVHELEAALEQIVQRLEAEKIPDAVDLEDYLFHMGIDKAIAIVRDVLGKEGWHAGKESYDIYMVRGGIGMPFIHDKVDSASSREEADRIVAQYLRMWENVYHKKCIPQPPTRGSHD